MLRKNVKLLLEELQVCIFAEIVFGVRCTSKKIQGFCQYRPKARETMVSKCELIL